jgi:hypothetical protein
MARSASLLIVIVTVVLAATIGAAEALPPLSATR